MNTDVVAHPAALVDARNDLAARHASNRQSDSPVIEQDFVPDPNITHEPLVLYGDPALVLRIISLEKHDLAPRRQREGGRKYTGAHFGAAEILQGRHALFFLGASLLQPRQATTMFLMGPVREVEPRDVHASFDQLTEALHRIASGAKGAYEFGATNGHF